MNTGLEIEIALAACAGLTQVIIAFIKARHSRKVTITTKDNRVIHAESLSESDLERIILEAKNIMAIETRP